MKNLNYFLAVIAAIALLFSSCIKEDDNRLQDDSEKATLTFEALLKDFASERAATKQTDDLPECSADDPVYVEIIVLQGDTQVVGTTADPFRLDLVPGQIFTDEAPELQLAPGTYTLDHFAVYNAVGELLWLAPRTGGTLADFVDNPLPQNINLDPGVKKYVEVPVLCFDDRDVNEYGYLFFEFNGNQAIEFCIFGNFCDEKGRHFPAAFSVDVWMYENGERSTQLYSDLSNTVALNEDGDYAGSPLCIALPDRDGEDEYYFEITLLDSDAYDAEEGIIRSGVISDEDVRSLYDGDTDTEYYHFREGRCGLVDSPVLFVDVDLDIIAEDMVSPIGLVAAPDESKRLFVIDQIGKIWVIDETGTKLSEPFLDLTGKIVNLNPDYDERGLLGLAFHPDYVSNGRFFVYYTAPPRAGGPEPGESWDNLSRISEFRVSSDPIRADIGSERVILEVDQPQSNHEGGTIAFGPEGYLYISLGDGGGANDVGPGHVEDWYDVNEGGNGQNIEANLLGKILRIDIDGGNPYNVPLDNPYLGEPGLDEIYAYGFRNPYRFSFDMGDNHRLFVGDAGQKLWEEISVVEKGGNYGWNVKEGTHCFNAANNMEVLPTCPEVDIYGNRLIDPVIEMRNHDNPLGGRTLVIVGGYVYRGNTIPDFEGQYIFGSFARSHEEPSGEIFISTPSGPGLWSFHEIDLSGNHGGIGYFLKGFGQDLEGEIYVAVSSVMGPSGNTGKILKLVP